MAPKHGHACRGKQTPTYQTWVGMHKRCSVLTNEEYQRYGGRGISVCERWFSFENFLADMGVRPERMTLDRIDSNGNYEASNCRWATPKEQAANRRDNVKFEIDGLTLHLSEWCRRFGKKFPTIWRRINDQKLSPRVALTKPGGDL